jgi:hypothetical protein
VSFSIQSLADSIEKNLPSKEGLAFLTNQQMKWRSKVPRKKAEQISCIINDLEKQCGKRVTCRIFEACGEDCLGKSVIDKAKRLYRKSTDIIDFIDKLNECHIGGGNLTHDNGTIHVVYKKCYCDTISQSLAPISMTYCNCSKGWLKKLFQSVYDTNIRVELIGTIMHGADQCTFNVIVQSKNTVQTQ